MVEINNQRKAFLDMLAWSEGTDNGRQRNAEMWIMASFKGETSLPQLSITSRKCMLGKTLKSTAGADFLASPAWSGMPISGGLKTWKWTLWHCSRLRAWRWLIGDIVRQSTVAAISGLHCRALVMVSSSIRLTAWLQNSKKRAERSERFDVWAESPRLSPLWLSASSSACHGLLIITVITPLPTKPSATKMPERNWAGERGNYWHADASAWCCCARCKIHEGELADAKAENDALRDDVAAGRRRLHIKAVCQSVREATTASGVDNAASPDWQTPLNGIISPSERGWSLCKNNWKEQETILMSSADRVAHIDGQLILMCREQYTRASAEYKCLK